MGLPDARERSSWDVILDREAHCEACLDRVNTSHKAVAATPTLHVQEEGKVVLMPWR